MSTLHRCTHCFLTGKPEFMKPASAFGVAAPQEVQAKILEEGAWARCLHCREEANKARCRAGLPALHVKSDTDSQRECKDDEGVQCSKCGKCRPYEFYPAAAIKHKARNKDVVCNVCQELTR